MKRFDKRLKKQLKREAPKIPAQAEAVFDKAINKIKAEQMKRKPWFVKYCAALAVIAAVIFLFLNFGTEFLDEERNIAAESDNCSSELAEKNRNVVKKPQIEEMESIRVGMIDCRNPEIRRFTDMILVQFKKDRKESQKSPAIHCEVLANTERWFTLCLIVQEEEGDTAYYYYNVDKRSECIVRMSDLFVGEFDYVGVFSEEIKKQMKEEIESEGDKKYWAASNMEGDYKIDRNQKFYFNQKGNLVILLEKGEVSPEETGSLRFVIEKGVFETALK